MFICEDDFPYHWQSTLNGTDTTFQIGTQSGVYGLASPGNPCPGHTLLVLNVEHHLDTSFTITACDFYFWHGNLYTTSGTYYYTQPDGCHQKDTLYLTIIPGTARDTIATAYDSFDWYDFTNITQSGDLIDADGSEKSENRRYER